jgi:aerobic-type carbon monoxide dehydrogenase small subunit (CoxS/CutS family)
VEESFVLNVNGQARTVRTDPERPLMDVLREDLSLTGTKCGCGEGRCGSCTVLIDGQAEHACVTTVGSVNGRPVLTIEGLSADGELHPVQEAFLAENSLQCGYCTPGMIMGVVGLLRQRPHPTDDEILTSMEGHICRCCGYRRILKAIKRAAAASGGQKS